MDPVRSRSLTSLASFQSEGFEAILMETLSKHEHKGKLLEERFKIHCFLLSSRKNYVREEARKDAADTANS